MKLFNTQHMKISLEKAQQLFEKPKASNKFDFLINLIKGFFCYIPKSIERKLFIKQLSKEIELVSHDSQGNLETIKKIITLISTNKYPISKIESNFKLKQDLISSEDALKQDLINKENIIKQQTLKLNDKENIINQQAHVIFENHQHVAEVIKKYEHHLKELYNQNITLNKNIMVLYREMSFYNNFGAKILAFDVFYTGIVVGLDFLLYQKIHHR